MTLVARNTAIQRAQAGEAASVPHLSIAEVQELAEAAGAAARKGHADRDTLLIQTIFDGCFRVSEALQLTAAALRHTQAGWSAQITGKGGKPAQVAISASLAANLQALAYRQRLEPNQRIFQMAPPRVWQIVDRAFQRTGIPKPAHVGTVHVLRHSGALARLALTGNPKALQDHLRHQSAKMTLRYLKTLSAEESLRINQEVDFRW